MKQQATIIVLFILSACTSPPEPDYYYNEIVVRNKTESPVSGVAIRVPNTNAVFSCSHIAPNGECSNKFRKRKYLGNPITISWTYRSNRKTKSEFVLNLPADLHPDTPFRGVLEITKDGMIKHYIEQYKN